jgi:excisionase family DNA binding protein
MVQKYYNSVETAKLLDVSTEDVKAMLERRELHGYRDGADWKFKVEDIDSFAKQRQSEKSASPEQEPGGDVLLSEVALGQGAMGSSGTVIAMDAGDVEPDKSDIRVPDRDVMPAAAAPAPAPPKEDAVDAKAAQFEELNLTLDEDIALEDSSGTLRNLPIPGVTPEVGSSAIDLSGKGLEDDDLVLGGSGIGSDVSIGGDSGISLVDPADTGISLEQPLDHSSGMAESLELGEGDMLSVGETGGGTSGSLKTDDDFLLTPLEETADTEDSESGSQVIALDTEGDEESAAMGSGAGSTMAAMLDEDLATQPGMDMGLGAAMAGAPLLGLPPSGLPESAPMAPPMATMPEASYTGWQIAGLAVCAVLLLLCGMMMYDQLRNMWSWEGPYPVNSSLMDLIVGLFEGK